MYIVSLSIVFSSLFLPSLIKGTRNREQCLATGNTKTIGIRKEKEKGKKKEEKEGRKEEKRGKKKPLVAFLVVL